MESICGADCNSCGYGKNNNCKGCSESNGCPFGKQCFIAKYIKTIVKIKMPRKYSNDFQTFLKFENKIFKEFLYNINHLCIKQ